MKTILTIAAVMFTLFFIAWQINESDRYDCEVRTAKEVNAETKYIDGQCLIKGWGAK